MADKEKEALEFKVEEEGQVKKKDQIKERETWGRAFDFLLACTGFSVGLGNVWRFPYLCYKNGGGAFLIPYLICVIVGGIPLFFLEVAVGQFMGVAGINAWNLCPIFRGIGISTTLIVFFLNCYYNVILAWAFYYFFASFTSKLPWTDCDPEWATSHCSKFDREDIDNSCNYTYPNQTTWERGGLLKNFTFANGTVVENENETCVSIALATYNNVSIFQDPGYLVEPVTEYWENKVLAISDGIHNMGPVKWDICLCLLFAWIVVYLCICQGIRSSGKVMYVTATSPYLFMTALLIRNSLLEGAKEGIIFYVKPDFEKMANIQVWVDAGTQIFFSYSISLGALTALGSYNKFNHNSYRDAIIFACTNSGTSIFAGFIIFSILGHMAHVQNKDIAVVAESGPGLAFIAYPKAVSLMPLSPLWSVLFFLMVILLGLDSQFVGVEGVITSIVDQWPGFLRKGHRREVFIGIVCIVHFLVGLSMVCPGGMYVFQLFDYYSGSRIILFVAAFMCVAVAWIYGVRRFYDNIEMMLGWRINPYMMVCWTVLSPLFCMTIFIMSAINYSELDYARPSGTYTYPQWAVAVGWTMAAFTAMWIPIVWIYSYVKYGPSWETFKLSFRPKGFQPHQLRPQDQGERTLDDLERERNPSPPAYNDVARPYTVTEPYKRPGAGSDNPAYTTDPDFQFQTKL